MAGLFFLVFLAYTLIFVRHADTHKYVEPSLETAEVETMLIVLLFTDFIHISCTTKT